MLEFTGERVVPGLVDPNLFNEHLARYRFAARFAHNAHVLDSGCGTGYGTAELTDAASVVALDISTEAVAWARGNFHRPGVHFIQGASESLPFADASFDVVLAFEVIEHLESWERMLAESRRVLRPSGILLVSTPNKAFYNESRAAAGPNPYHVREFECREFEAALKAVFPHVRLWSQNHSEAITFAPASASHGILDAAAGAVPELAHFYFAACSQCPIAHTGSFAWLPSAGNILRERQHHISLLESELDQKDLWLEQARDSLETLHASHESVLVELDERNVWAARLNAELDAARTRINELQCELESAHNGYREQLARLESEGLKRLEWVHDLESQIERGRAEIARLDQESTDRTNWALSLDEEIARLRARIQAMEEPARDFDHNVTALPGQPE